MEGRAIKIGDRDNVMEHLLGHMSFRNSLEFSMMPPEYVAAFDEHLAQTKLQLARGVIQQQMAMAGQGPAPIQAPQQPSPMGMGVAGSMGGMGGNQAGANISPGGNAGMGSPQNEAGAGVFQPEQAPTEFGA
jgi:hypothetical protein